MQHQVLVVSRHQLFAEGIASLLAQRADVRVVGMIAAPSQLKQAVRDLQPDVIIVDCKDCGLIQRVIRQVPQVRVITVTLNDNTLDLYETAHVEMTSIDDLFAAIDGPVSAGGRSAEETGSDHHA
jgi:DNA-binding NarL/FixJ family response regulator